tara:strand:+ start:51 stop:797 length:747 start_codon:yes stop_codon:yes gene_type:complete
MRYHTVITVSSVILCWELVFKGGYIPGLWDIISTFFILLVNPDFLYNLWTSIWRLIIGWSIGMVTGTSIGIVMGTNYHARKLIMPLVSSLFPIPKIALLPLFVVLLGLGEASKITTIFIGAFFPSIITAYSSVLRTPKTYIEAGRACGGHTYMIISKIILPYNLPTIIQGFRTSGSLALTLLVAAEMLGAKYGLGHWIFLTGGEMDFAEMFAGIIWLSIIGLSINWGVDYLRRTVCHWSALSEGNDIK